MLKIGVGCRIEIPPILNQLCPRPPGCLLLCHESVVLKFHSVHTFCSRYMCVMWAYFCGWVLAFQVQLRIRESPDEWALAQESFGHNQSVKT